MKTETELLALRLWLGVAATTDIDIWLDQYVHEVAEPHPEALELFSIPFEQQASRFMALARSVFGFDPDTERGSQVAAVLVAQLCEAALEERVSVPEFCETIARIDSKYITPGLRAPYPQTLAELWNGCDWCDETWSLDHPAHVRTLLSENSVPRDPSKP
jgi:hypothetical protein